MAWQKRNMFSSAVDMQRGGAVPWPGYFTGGQIRPTRSEIMPMQLFEEGDQDINMALNNLESTTNPSIEQIKDTEAVSIGPSMEQEMTMDQGPVSFESELGELKQDFTNEVLGFAQQPRAAEKIEAYLKTVQLAYENELDALKRKHGVKEWSPEQDLFTPEFMAQVKGSLGQPEIQVQEMQNAGLVVPQTQEQLNEVFKGFPSIPTMEQWTQLDDETKQKFTRYALVQNITGGLQSQTVLGTDPAVKARLEDIIRTQKNLAKKAYAPPTKQGGILGFASQYNATQAAQAAAESKALSDEMRLLMGQQGTGTTGKALQTPSDTFNELMGITTGSTDKMKIKDILDSAQAMTSELNMEGRPYATMAVFRDLSPDKFLVAYPQFGGQKAMTNEKGQIIGAYNNIDELINERLEGVDPSDPYSTTEAVESALQEWVTLNDLTQEQIDALATG